MKKISVIVPIYNSEMYLKECIESILNQSYSNIELLLVDDGSTDNSSEICSRFLSDNRVKFIQKENGGVSSARNKGISESTGDYIMFVDSDDYIEVEMIEKMINNLNNSQFVFCGYNEFFCNKVFNHRSELKKYTCTSDIINALFNSISISGFLWNKIYDAKIIKKYNLKLDQSVHYCEDLLFNIEYLIHINDAIVISDCLYNYRMRNSSATWSIDSEKAANLLICFDKLDSLLKTNNLYNDNYIYYKLNLLYKYSILNIKKITKSEFDTLLKSKDISIKRKAKLIIMRNFKIIYIMYMNKKVNKNILFN